MTGIERLRELTRIWTWDCKVVIEQKKLADIADQIERERACDSDTAENIRLIVGGVIDDMERHVSGHEGMEDSPVARWARELRDALGGDGRDPADDVSMSAYDLLPQEEREAIAWVREHGGLDAVKRRWECLSYYADPVPRARMEKRLARLQRQIDESHAALRRRREIISELNRRACDLTRENAELRKRAMPDGMCWPVFEDGEPVRLGDFVSDVEVRSVVFRDGGILLSDCTSVPGWGTWRSYKEPIKRPAPKVPDADGVEIRVGDTLWHVETGEQCKVVGVDSRSVSVDYRVDGDGTKHTGSVLPSKLTHRAPVLAADGRPLSAGETVFYGNVMRTVDHIEYEGENGSGAPNVFFTDGGWSYPTLLTHERPDSWERIEEDAGCTATKYNERRGTIFTTKQQVARDLVRRCRALAERGE